jgi:hypothetical protein
MAAGKDGVTTEWKRRVLRAYQGGQPYVWFKGKGDSDACQIVLRMKKSAKSLIEEETLSILRIG